SGQVSQGGHTPIISSRRRSFPACPGDDPATLCSPARLVGQGSALGAGQGGREATERAGRRAARGVMREAAAERRRAGLNRGLTPRAAGARGPLDLASNDYLGLGGGPRP